ncbi:MAG: hypothetical protein II956_11025 [Bacteroidales bacterium]|nr:hypothetical protein [Bacteroidales bacterium]
MAEQQLSYVQAYEILNAFFVLIKETTISISSFPTDYQKTVGDCFDKIKIVVSNYATTLGNSLKVVPQQMINDLDIIMPFINEALAASLRLVEEDNDSDTFNDEVSLYKGLSKASAFCNSFSSVCNDIVIQLDKFYQEGGDGCDLASIEVNMRELIYNIEQSCSEYANEENELTKEINKLKEQMKTKITAAVGTGIGVGVFVTLGIAAIALMATGGAGAPVIIPSAILVVGVLAAGATTVGIFGKQASDTQKLINEKSGRLSTVASNLEILKGYHQDYVTNLKYLGELKNAVTRMSEEWRFVSNELSVMASEVQKAVKEAYKIEDVDLDFISNELQTIVSSANTLHKKLEVLNVEETKVSTAKLNISMSEQEAKSIFENSGTIDILTYLRVA